MLAKGMKYLRLLALGSCIKLGLSGVGGFAYYSHQRAKILKEPAVKEFVATQDAIKTLEEKLSVQTFPQDETLYKEYDTAVKYLQATDPQVLSEKKQADSYGRNAMYAFIFAAIGISSTATLWSWKKRSPPAQ